MTTLCCNFRAIWHARRGLGAVAAVLLLGLLAPVYAQDAEPPDGGPDKDSTAADPDRGIPERYRDERDLPSDVLLRAEFKRRHPGIDPEKAHNVADIQNPADEEDRYAYTMRMTKVIDLWIVSGNGAALSKILDEQAETKDRQAVFLTLHGYFFLHWPMEDPMASATSAEKQLLAAVAVAPDFAVAGTLLAMFQLRVFRISKAAETERLLNAALAKRPGHVEAALVKCTLLNELRRGEELKALARRFAESPGLTPMELDTLLGYFAVAETDNAAARTFLNGLLAKAAAPEMRAMVMRQLASVLLKENKYADAMSTSVEAIGLLDPAKHGDLIMLIRITVMERTLVRETIAAQEAKDADREKALEAAREKLLLEGMEFDLRHLGPTDESKGAVMERIDDFMSARGRDKDNLGLMLRYDRESKLLTRVMREKLRVRIERLEVLTGIRLPLERLREWAESSNPADHALLADQELASYIRFNAAEPEKHRFDKPEVFALFIELCAHSHRGVSRRAMRLAGIGAMQAGTVEAKEKAMAAISARLANEKTLADIDVRSLVQDGLNALLYTGGREGALRVASWIGALGDSMDGTAVRSEARSFAGKAVDAAGLKANRQLSDGAGEMRTGVDAAAWAKLLAEKVAEAKAAEAAAAKPAGNGGDGGKDDGGGKGD